MVTLTRPTWPSGVPGRLRAKSSSSPSVLHDSNRRHVCQRRAAAVGADRAAQRPQGQSQPTQGQSQAPQG